MPDGPPQPLQALSDGIVEEVWSAFDVPFGFGGLTLPDRGFPIPCRLLIAEMARLGCDFAFLRRSFLRDVARGRVGESLDNLRAAVEAALAVSFEDQESLHEELLRAVDASDAYFAELNRVEICG